MTNARHGHEHEEESVHSFLLAGRETIHGYHLAMFGMAEHRYQVLVRYNLPGEVIDTYLADRASHPASFYAVRNTVPMLLPPLGDGTLTEYPARLDRVTQTGNGEDRIFEPIKDGFTARVGDVLHFRKFSQEDFPPYLVYLIYGAGEEAHIAHRLVDRPHFEQIIDLRQVPDGITQQELSQGLEVTIPAVPDNGHAGAPWTTRPLPDTEYRAILNRNGDSEPITLALGEERWWNITTLNA
jgi:hypothetical protein